jgi:hypothetical protein
MSRSYVCNAEPHINPTTFWFCQERDKAFIFQGTARADFFCDHLNKGTRVAGITLETFHLEPRGEAQFAIYSDTPFEDLARLGNPAQFNLPDMK